MYQANVLNYDRQMAWYKMGAVANGLVQENTDCFLIAVEKEAPYAFSINFLSEERLEQGKQKYDELLSIYLETVAQSKFYGDSIDARHPKSIYPLAY